MPVISTYCAGPRERSINSTREKRIVSDRNNRICPVERAGGLDIRIRRWVHNPQKILRPYIREGMTVLDIGCGPGFFSIDMALLAGESGRVIAADLQNGMLEKLRDKIRGTELEDRIILHKCGENRIGVSEKIDFILAFYVVHEIPDKEIFFGEIEALLKPGGHLLIAEPPFHVSKSAFEETVGKARNAGLTVVERPWIGFSKTAVFKKGCKVLPVIGHQLKLRLSGCHNTFFSSPG